ncbi:MAG: YdeI/OmpD-associated family protein [Saprospiraceae bacterium]|nr:YdeI/OmpD-associated family protein [Saprospiraceae bacterium]
MSEAKIKSFKSHIAWRNWLEKNQELQVGIWLQVYKKNAGIETVTIEQALAEALCFGWIDGQRKSYDEQSYLQKYTPRRSQSIWSKRNIRIVESLIKEGRMMTRGFAEFEKAKIDGRLAKAYDSHTTMQDAEDLMIELNKDEEAKSFYNSLNKSNKFAINFRLQTAKKPETRSKRMNEIIQMMKEKKKFH